MDRIVSRINESLAAPHSRKGFLARLGALALGTGAALAGVGGTAAAGCCPSPSCSGSPGYPNCPTNYTPGNPGCCFSGGLYYPYIPCTPPPGGGSLCYVCGPAQSGRCSGSPIG